MGLLKALAVRFRSLTRKASKLGSENPPKPRLPKREIEKVLDGWSAQWPNDFNGDVESYKPDRMQFPIPELVVFLLRDVMGWRCDGPGEKVGWTVYGSILGEAAAFELRKFGFTIIRPPDAKANSKRVEGQLRSAVRLVEKALEPRAKFQVDQGRVTIVNRDHEFRQPTARQTCHPAHPAICRAAFRVPDKFPDAVGTDLVKPLMPLKQFGLQASG